MSVGRGGRQVASVPATSFATAAPWTVLFGPWSVGVGLAIIALAVSGRFWIDPAAIGVDLCWFRRLSGGLPCPGCGLTRSMVALGRGSLGQAFDFHPFGPLLMAWALAAASSPIWPQALRQGIRMGLEARRRPFDRAYRGLVVAFVVFGLGRTLWTLIETQR